MIKVLQDGLTKVLVQADDGWKTEKHGGKFLAAYKLELARRRFAAGKLPSAEPGKSHTAPHSGHFAQCKLLALLQMFKADPCCHRNYT